MIRKQGRIRTQYHFARPLTDPEEKLLVEAAFWRKGSNVLRDMSGAIIGCVCHPDDLSHFRKQLRERGIRKRTDV